jgi:predicted site-specific integrase-resolvase
MGWVGERRLVVDRVMSEIGSGLNGQRPKLARLLADPQVTTIVVEHRNRLARFGVEQPQRRFPGTGGGSWSQIRPRRPMTWCAIWSRF